VLNDSYFICSIARHSVDKSQTPGKQMGTAIYSNTTLVKRRNMHHVAERKINLTEYLNQQ